MRMGTTGTVGIGKLMQRSNERFHGRISDEIGMASRRNLIPRDQTKSPILGDHHHHHCCCCTTWRDTMDRKVTIAQTRVRRIQWDFNLMAMADGANAFPSTMFSDGTCSTEGAIPRVDTNLTLQNTASIMTGCVSQLQITSNVKSRPDCNWCKCGSITTMFVC